MHATPIETPDGMFTACFSGKGLARLDFPAGTKPSTSDGEPFPANLRPWRRLTETALKQVLRGEEARALPPLDLSAGTDFQRSVWAALTRIPLGRTLSYGEIAKAIHRPGAARAVGQACGANPIPLFVPCHRVFAAGGQIGGFSCGLEWKRKLLRREGVI